MARQKTKKKSITGTLLLALALPGGRPGLTGVRVLETGSEALLSRAWLAGNAQRSIDVQYFIWSTDNVGILAAEALLGAAERGVRVRVLVDDLMVDAPPESLLALDAHPRIEIRIYNPKLSVGVGRWKRLINSLTDLKGVNQRMHDKTFIVDGQVAIAGGRNMADEYFDYDHEYNFRDRDVLFAGAAVVQAGQSFEMFWNDPLAVPVERLIGDPPSPARAAEVHRELHLYADNPANFEPAVRQAIEDIPKELPALIRNAVWTKALFLSDRPGKNLNRDLTGGGRTTAALEETVDGARRSVTIESPYLVLTERGLALFSGLVRRGVKVRIVTNSLAATDNLMAFSAYHRQRSKLAEAGIVVREFRPDAAVQRELALRWAKKGRWPIFAVHAKTMVVDGEIALIGSFNLDPRSAHLNTEVGLLIFDRRIASRIEAALETDMLPENSWAADGKADSLAPWNKRLKCWFWGLLPIEPLL